MLESFVTQDTHLFHDSIRNNLRIAKLDATDEEIESKVESLLKKMTLDEKIGQMCQLTIDLLKDYRANPAQGFWILYPSYAESPFKDDFLPEPKFYHIRSYKPLTN